MYQVLVQCTITGVTILARTYSPSIKASALSCMAVAIHLGKTKKMDYKFCDFDTTKWPNYLAYYVLKDIAKFSDHANAATNVAPAEDMYDIHDDKDNKDTISNLDSGGSAWCWKWWQQEQQWW
jgi:hypothetical protein